MHIAESRVWFDAFNYSDSLQARAIEEIDHCIQSQFNEQVQNTRIVDG